MNIARHKNYLSTYTKLIQIVFYFIFNSTVNLPGLMVTGIWLESVAQIIILYTTNTMILMEETAYVIPGKFFSHSPLFHTQSLKFSFELKCVYRGWTKVGASTSGSKGPRTTVEIKKMLIN